MKWPPFRKFFSTAKHPDPAMLPFELEACLERQISQGDLPGVITTLNKLNRRLYHTERRVLIYFCLDHELFAEAFFLTGQLPSSADRTSMLGRIVRETALAGNFNIARAAALLIAQSEE